MRAHGTHACYVFGVEKGAGRGCRCEECRAARTIYERERTRRTVPPYVDAGEVRAHLQWLSENGIGLKTVARRTGLSTGTLTKIVYGGPGTRPPARRVRPETREKILAVTPADIAGGGRVPAGPVWAMVNTLLERGWTKAAIARGIGQERALQLGTDMVTAENAAAVKALLDAPVPPRRSRHGTHPVPQLATEEDDGSVAPWDDRDQAVLDLAITLEGRIDARDWRRRAVCTRPNVPTWVFFPGRGDTETFQAARDLCATCPVQEQCLAEGLALPLNDDTGVRAGLSAKQRRDLRKETAA